MAGQLKKNIFFAAFLINLLNLTFFQKVKYVYSPILMFTRRKICIEFYQKKMHFPFFWRLNIFFVYKVEITKYQTTEVK